ncbi:MerR family transcriptional regulator [Plantactinospora sp. GCM10030261]|uniref:helix-turn-helix domain-containing protein n=1 Tax=Plantactinospora sp. GCM10030261 TaxID=3273420 RepID=UPI00360FCC34
MKSSVEETGIGDLAAHFGLATHVLRHWESEGLLRPRRAANGQRRYTPQDRTRIAIVLHGRRAGLSVPELRRMLAAEDPVDRRAVLRQHLTELDERIAAATRARELIDHALHCPAEDVLRCPDLNRIVHVSHCSDVPCERDAPPSATDVTGSA